MAFLTLIFLLVEERLFIKSVKLNW